jgi:hypothetical protein
MKTLKSKVSKRQVRAKRDSTSPFGIIIILVSLIIFSVQIYFAFPSISSSFSFDLKNVISSPPISLPSAQNANELYHALPTNLNLNDNNVPLKSGERRPRVAFAITITKDGSFQDGAAVLAYSIVNVTAGRSFDCSLIAFVHPNVTNRDVLRRLGYHVIEAPTPIK